MGSRAPPVHQADEYLQWYHQVLIASQAPESVAAGTLA